MINLNEILWLCYANDVTLYDENTGNYTINKLNILRVSVVK